MNAPGWDGGRVLSLPFECLETLPGGMREVRVWYDSLTDQLVVGKRLDLTMVESGVLIEPQLLAAVTHDHVVPILAAAQDHPCQKPGLAGARQRGARARCWMPRARRLAGRPARGLGDFRNFCAAPNSASSGSCPRLAARGWQAQPSAPTPTSTPGATASPSPSGSTAGSRAWFSFGPARAEACAAAAWLDLGLGREAQDAAERALLELTAQPAGRQPFSQVSGARIDLASARLVSRDRDGVQDIIEHVLAVPPSLRNVSLSGRLARLRTMLAAEPWSDDPPAQRLSEAIAAWMSEGPDSLSA
jgi:hypothetical protein